jgi:DinB superfamily
MDTKQAMLSQYRAALEMLRQAVVRCPESSWDAAGDKNRFWHVAYHTLFFTSRYLYRSREEFTPWVKHRERYHLLDSLPPLPDGRPQTREPYSKEDVLAYLDICREQVGEKLPVVDLDDTQSGFPWLPFGKLEVQIYNIRHLQHHTGELLERLGVRDNVDVDWVFAGPSERTGS